MSKIHVVTDSGSDLPQEVLETLQIHVVPLTVQFGEEIYRDGVDISVEEFYRKLEAESEIPSTCQPSPADFVRVYENIAQPGDTIISIHLSSKMSGTYQSAVLAASMLDPNIDVKVIDSQCASLGIGVVAAAAARAVQAGADVEQVLAELKPIIDNLQVYFVVDTLEYLQKNGRIGMASAFMGTLLSIKPILTVQDGMVAPFEKIRGKAKALNRIRELMEEFKNRHPDRKLTAAISNANAREDAERLARYLEGQLPLEREIIIGSIGPTIGVHTGAGTIALFIYPV
ncbi:MAG TPA: DegV family protein [Firmicutes bacterium]|nr:DegV family protein [Bacillota bacterium]